MSTMEMLADVPVMIVEAVYDRREGPRYAFGGVAEITVLHPQQQYLIGPVTELSRSGCFVRTSALVPVGAEVTVKITYDGTEFHASGKVIYVLNKKGMGIMFSSDTTEDELRLEEWLSRAIA